MQTGKTDQTGWMPRLIQVFVGAHAILLVLSCGGSFLLWVVGLLVGDIKCVNVKADLCADLLGTCTHIPFCKFCCTLT